ncbi:Nuclear pore protein 84/107 [Dillenia turbinata]|uniref:Nuclear pore complex protein n=1 Tax=Dillenia turbinata TaxID=194707 RepID=A0AAN8UJN1_9MAGN
MEVEMETSPSYYDPEDLNTREEYRRYGKRHSSSSMSPLERSKFSDPRFSHDGQRTPRWPNAALFLEDIKKEVESSDADHLEGTFSKAQSVSRRRVSINSHSVFDMGAGVDSVHGTKIYSLKSYKPEDDALPDSEETTFSSFASLLDSALQGSLPVPYLILQYERSCRSVSESIRYGSTGSHRLVEDKFLRQKARVLLDEAASWSLLWYLYGKGNEEFPEELILSPPTSHLEACQFVASDHTAQLCLRIVQWLEELASKSLDLDYKVRGSYVGSYLPSSGIWHNTQRLLKRGNSNSNTIHHLDFDAPTREQAQPLPDDKRQDESLLEDVWVLVRAGRLEEACELCRSAGQPWRAATLCPFGGLDQFPSIEPLLRNRKNRILQAIELESGVGRQWCLWKWASYCASEKIAEQDGGKYEMAVYAAQCSNLKRMLPICMDWESACWAMAKSWLDFQVDLELTRMQPGRTDQFRSSDGFDGSPGQLDGASQSSVGPDSWPLQVINQQPRQISAFLQKLHSSDTVHEAVTRGCKEQHRQIEMNLMVGDIPHLMDLIWSWISPSDDDDNVFRPHGDPQMIRFGAHLVLVLRYLLADQMKDAFKEKITIVGDLIIHMWIYRKVRYAMFLFSKQHEELVGIYASQLACHRCIDLFVHMMELRLNESMHVKYKIFLSAVEYLPFSPGDDSKGSFEEIIERVLSRSRETKLVKFDKAADVAEQHRLQSLQKAMVIQWLCFTPPSTVNDVEVISTKLLVRALIQSNILFREFALISMWRVPAMPIGAHTLLSYLVEPLKQLPEALSSFEDPNVSENLIEFLDWREYYTCDATYRNWLNIELENSEVPSPELSMEEKHRANLAAKETLDASLALLRKDKPWLAFNEDYISESTEPVFLELHATAVLCLPSGECLTPDAALCTTLMSALYSSAGDEAVLNRQLMVNVTISPQSNHCIEIVLRCLAVEGDGLGSHELNDGGVLGTVMAAGFKGELARFQAGVTIEISRLDAWYSSKDGSLEGPATYIVRGLCRKCCIPEVILRCMQVSVSLMESGNPPESHDELIELVSSPEVGFFHLFSQHQLQEFLLFEREYSICKMELEENGQDL